MSDILFDPELSTEKFKDVEFSFLSAFKTSFYYLYRQKSWLRDIAFQFFFYLVQLITILTFYPSISSDMRGFFDTQTFFLAWLSWILIYESSIIGIKIANQSIVKKGIFNTVVYGPIILMISCVVYWSLSVLLIEFVLIFLLINLEIFALELLTSFIFMIIPYLIFACLMNLYLVSIFLHLGKKNAKFLIILFLIISVFFSSSFFSWQIIERENFNNIGVLSLIEATNPLSSLNELTRSLSAGKSFLDPSLLGNIVYLIFIYAIGIPTSILTFRDQYQKKRI